MLVRLDHVASFIINANHSIMPPLAAPLLKQSGGLPASIGGGVNAGDALAQGEDLVTASRSV
jgi:hypothetical protein